MRDLIQLLIKSGGFLTFVFLEIICLFLVVSFNKKQQSIWLNSAGKYTGSIEKKRNEINQYFDLKGQNQTLAAENARLKNELENNRRVTLMWRDTFRTVLPDTISDKTKVDRYRFFPATVINNSVASFNNFLVIDRGWSDGVRPRMGVITSDGIVGIVRDVDKNYSLVLSILNPQSRVSAMLSKTGHFGSLVWEGEDPKMATLNDIPKHVQFAKGDTVVTSGFSEIFPKDMMIGTIENSRVDAGSNFFTIDVKLNNDLSRVQHVFVVDQIYKPQIDSLNMRANQ
jgi:rod shape-determining protein MreC